MEQTQQARRFEKKFLEAIFNDPLVNPTGEQAKRLAALAVEAFNAVAKDPPQPDPSGSAGMTDDDARARLAYLHTIHASRKWKPAQKDAYINLYNEAQRNRDQAIDGYAPVVATGRELAARLGVPRGVADNVRVQFQKAEILKLIKEDRHPVDRHGHRLAGRPFSKKLGDRWENTYTYGMRLDPLGTLPDLTRTDALKADVARKKKANEQQAEDVRKMQDELNRLRQMRCPECGAESEPVPDEKPILSDPVFSVRCNKCGAIFDDKHLPELHEHKPDVVEDREAAAAPAPATAPAEPHDGTESKPPSNPGDSPGLSPHGGSDPGHHRIIGGSDLSHRDGGTDSKPPWEPARTDSVGSDRTASEAYYDR
jgi:hypothetical protein